MIGNKKVIGVCMTQVHDMTRAEMIALLHQEIEKYGYKLIVFNSSFDFYYGSGNEIGAAGIYEYINLDLVDALIIFCTNFNDKGVYKKIIQRAHEKNIPVVLEEDLQDGCYTVRNVFEDAYKDLLRHLFQVHGVKDTYFVAGFPGSKESEARLHVYQEVLAEYGLPFREERMGYGCFWEGPTNQLMDQLLSSGEPVPQAFVCANDSMAIAVCSRLKKYGYRVPEDVVVTGFDGNRLGECSEPRITTCAMDFAGFLRKIASVVSQVLDKKEIPFVYDVPFAAKSSESCGCIEESAPDYRSLLKHYSKMLEHIKGHEHYIYEKINNIMNTWNIDADTFYSAIASIVDDDSFLAVRPSFLGETVSEDNFHPNVDEELMLVAQKQSHYYAMDRNFKLRTSDMIPDKEEWSSTSELYVICPVQVGSMLLGYYGVRTMDVLDDSNRINRVLNMINMISQMAISSFRQRYFKISKADNSLLDNTTELANLYGITNWFENFISNPVNEEKVMTVSIYSLPKYRFIYENYGTGEMKAAVCFVAEALRIANTTDCFLSRISDDEFVVINYMDSYEKISPVIDNATTVFYGLLEKYNWSNGKEFNIQVTAGCVETSVMENLKLETLIQQATQNMYKNMVQYGNLPAKKESAGAAKESYFRFNVLISQNLFSYFYQPIVSVDTGDIYGYEALMRTDQRIGMTPLDVLSFAEEYGRCYDVEKATIFNVMEQYVTSREAFGDRKVFINCIPGYFLNDDDNKRLSEKYSDHIDRFVFEITEKDTVTNDELNVLRKIGNKQGNNWIAVDDYGVGHSNIVNLINYAPQIVKIDRFLMTDIHKDVNKQIMVRGVIEFAKRNGIKILAEGIETADEMRKVIELGVDFVQGYYTGRPMKDPVKEIAPDVKAQIKEFLQYR